MTTLVVPILPYTLNTPVAASTTATYGPFQARGYKFITGIVNADAACTVYLDFTSLQLGTTDSPDFSQPSGSPAGIVLAAGVGQVIPQVVPAGRWARLRVVTGAGAVNFTYAVNGQEDLT